MPSFEAILPYLITAVGVVALVFALKFAWGVIKTQLITGIMVGLFFVLMFAGLMWWAVNLAHDVVRV